MSNLPFLVACALSDCNAKRVRWWDCASSVSTDTYDQILPRGAPLMGFSENPSPTAQLQTTESTCSKHMHSCRPEKCFSLLLVIGSVPCVSEAGLLGSASVSRSGSWGEDTSGNKMIE
jgi:hypothetical protein